MLYVFFSFDSLNKSPFSFSLSCHLEIQKKSRFFFKFNVCQLNFFISFT